MKVFLKTLLALAILFALLVAGYFYLADRPIPEIIRYGATFSKFRTDELKLPWKETYDAIIDDLKVRRLRLVAHWQMVEPERDRYNFEELDYEMRRAEEVGAEVILAVGRRLPSWPECHMPEWARQLSQSERDDEFFKYLGAVVDRYKDSPALKWWQVENEPYIIGFAYEQCGVHDVGFFDVEIGFVQNRDPHHPVLLTASGEIGVWENTWTRGDVFGTTLYRRVWNRDLNSFLEYPTWPGFFRAKRTLAEIITNEPDKPAIIAELAAEPWPRGAIVDTPLQDQLARMDRAYLQETVDFAKQTSFDEQYFWGVEWWYYLKTVHNEDEIWEWGKQWFTE